MGRVEGPKNMFRRDKKRYTARMIDFINEGEHPTVVDYNDGRNYVIAAFDIHDPFDEYIGSVGFTMTPSISAISAHADTPLRSLYKTIDETAEVFTNLLTYLPLDMEFIADNGLMFEFRFQSYTEDGKAEHFPLYLVNSSSDLNKTMRRIVLKDSEDPAKAIHEAIKEALYCKYHINPHVGIRKNTFQKMVGVYSSLVDSSMQRLVDSGLAKVVSETDQEPMISIKAEYKLIQEMEGGGERPIMQDNRQYITTVRGDVTGSAINVAVEGDIHQEFENTINEVDNIEGLNDQQKKEVKELMAELDAAMADEKKDENKIVGIIKKIGGISKKAVELLLKNATLVPLVAKYALQALA